MTHLLSHIDIFTGLGGFTLAAHANGFKTEVMVEKDKRCRQFLERAWPGIPIHDDIETLVKACEEFVHIAGSERFLKITPDVSHAIRLMSENGEIKIENYEGRRIENTTKKESKRSSTIMVGNVPVVGSIGWNSFVLIIKKITEMTNASDITLRQHGKLPSKESSPTIIRSSATTATMQKEYTGYAHIRRPELLTAGVPCQPASRAGKQRGAGDVRWLWPQTISIAKYFNAHWCLFENPPGIDDVGLDGILSDLEAEGYEVAPILDIPACAVNSPQLRHRYWIVANAKEQGHKREKPAGRTRPGRRFAECGSGSGMAHAAVGGQRIDGSTPRRAGHPDERGENGDMDNANEGQRRSDATVCTGRASASLSVEECDMADTEAGTIGAGLCEAEPGEERGRRPCDMPGGLWDSFLWLPCADGRFRRAPDDSFGLVDGVHRSILAALGNSIVWKVAAEIIGAIRTAHHFAVHGI